VLNTLSYFVSTHFSLKIGVITVSHEEKEHLEKQNFLFISSSVRNDRVGLTQLPNNIIFVNESDLFYK